MSSNFSAGHYSTKRLPPFFASEHSVQDTKRDAFALAVEIALPRLLQVAKDGGACGFEDPKHLFMLGGEYHRNSP